MAPLDDYTIQTRNLHKRYKLSASIMSLFKALGEHRRGTDRDALGRLVRISAGMRKACTDTIGQLAEVMAKDQSPSTVAECTEIIKGCTEVLALAEKPASSHRLPLMKLPAEVRRGVYKHYLSSFIKYSDANYPKIICKTSVAGCGCLPFQNRPTARKINIDLALTSKAVKKEVMAAFFEGHTFHFTCGCELESHLSKNASLRDNVKRLKVHWTGPKSAAGFKLLKEASTLKILTIVISKSTTNHLSKREVQIQRFFNHKGQARLTDAEGFDELLDLGSLEGVMVQHIDKSQAHRRTNEERHNLELMLQAVIVG